MNTIRLLIVEDQTLMRQGLKTILDLEPGLRVVGEAADGERGVQLALELKPDVVLMDVQLPRLNGVQATAELVRQWPEARVIILTTFDRDDYVYQGMRAGALGYLQTARRQQILRAGEGWYEGGDLNCKRCEGGVKNAKRSEVVCLG